MGPPVSGAIAGAWPGDVVGPKCAEVVGVLRRTWAGVIIACRWRHRSTAAMPWRG
jgi:hypothetical protein